MRVAYNPTSSTKNLKNVLHDDLGVYHIQSGAGVGGFFKNLFKKLLPIGKTILKHGFTLAKPGLNKMASNILDEGVNQLTESAQKLKKYGHKKIGMKRGRDELS